MDKELLNNLCRRYGFSYDEIGCYIRIKSYRATWYIVNMDYQKHLIELFHENTRGKAYMHSHEKHKTLSNIFKCINSHDNNGITIKNNDMINVKNYIALN